MMIVEFDTDFTWAKGLADNQGPNSSSFAGEAGGARATSILDRHADFGNVEGTRRLLWNTTVLYDLPIGRGKQFGNSMPRSLDALVGGWRLSNIFTAETGEFLTPYFPSGEGDTSGTGSGLDSTAAGWDQATALSMPTMSLALAGSLLDKTAPTGLTLLPSPVLDFPDGPSAHPAPPVAVQVRPRFRSAASATRRSDRSLAPVTST